MTIDIATADVLEWARTYDGPKFHAILCDPPYHLHDGKGAGGFMNKQWDGEDIAFRPETWAALAEHLHPGGFIMAFASSRGWHRLACAIEDAGLRIHPSIFGWAQGSGFPKATRIDTQIDKAAGAEREVIRARSYGLANDGGYSGGLNTDKPRSESCAITAPATPLAAAWEGHRYGGQALKPALEPIIVAQKPYAGKPRDCIVETGAGALWVDGGRVPTGGGSVGKWGAPQNAQCGNGGTMGDGWAGVPTEQHAAGRWPPNFVLSHVSLPVVRLRGQLPYGIIDAIGRYFDGYIRVQELRQGCGNNDLAAERREEVLQPEVQERIGSEGCSAGPVNVDLCSVQKIVSGSNGLAQGWAPEVLRAGVLDGSSSGADGGAVAALGQTSHLGIEGQDQPDPNRARVNGERPESSELEGRAEYSRGVCSGTHPNAAAGRASNGASNEADRGVHLRTPPDTGDGAWPPVDPSGSCSPSKRRETRQSPGEPCGCREGKAHPGAPGNRAGVDVPEGGEPTLEILACDVPDCWAEYFEPTGEDLGCRCVGERRVRGTAPIGRPSIGAPMLNHIGAVGVNGNPRPEWTNYADADGLETVAAWDCVESCSVRRLGEQSGERASGGPARRDYPGQSIRSNIPLSPQGEGIRTVCGHPDTGTAARFFPNHSWELDIAERIAAADPVLYAAKSSRRERNAGCEGLEERHLAERPGRDNCMNSARDPRYEDRPAAITSPARNPHPTVKPLALARWLATLLLPPDAYAPRRLLVPFAGSMSEAIAARLARWEHVTAIEQDPEYVEIGRARLAWWEAKMRETKSSDPGAILKACGKSCKESQDSTDDSPPQSLFDVLEAV